MRMGRKNIFGLVLFIIYLCLVAWCCFGHFDSLPDVGKDFFGIPMDKVVHFIMFFPFPFLCFWSFDYLAGSRLQGVLLTLGVLLAGCLVAGATEVGQYFTTYRSGDPADFLADFLALASGSVLVLIIFLSSKKTTTT